MKIGQFDHCVLHCPVASFRIKFFMTSEVILAFFFAREKPQFCPAVGLGSRLNFGVYFCGYSRITFTREFCCTLFIHFSHFIKELLDQLIKTCLKMAQK